jgi:hypothetical protein
VRIKYVPRYSSFNRPENSSIESLIEKACDGNDYGSGAVEAASRTASNAASMLGRLIDLLASRGTLSAEDVLELAQISGASDVAMT